MFTYKISTREKDKGWQWIIAYKDETGKWKQRAKQGYKTKSEAKNAANDYVFDLKAEVEANTKLNKEHKDITFKNFSTKFMDHKKVHCEVNTINAYENAFKKFSKLDNMKLTEIDTMDIQEVIDNMIKEGLSTQTISNYTIYISAAFKAAKKQWKIIKENPCEDVIVPKVVSKEKTALTLEEIDDLLSRLPNDLQYITCLIAVKCGLRVGEVVGLTWDDIDFKNKMINVDKQWKKRKDGTIGMGTVKASN